MLPHGSYLSNIGTIDETLYLKARTAMLEECKRVEALGLKYLNVHPGSTSGKCSKEESIAQIAKAINFIHSQTSYMTIVLENTAGAGGTVGVDFAELRSIIDQIENKSRIGVCLDTCHAFASGINIKRTNGIELMLEEFDKVIGLSYLKAMHLNDSMGTKGSNLDRHDRIGYGNLGLEPFRQILNCDKLRGIPLILETPLGEDAVYGENHPWAKEIEMLRGLEGKESVEEIKKGAISSFFSKKKSESKKKTEKEMESENEIENEIKNENENKSESESDYQEDSEETKKKPAKPSKSKKATKANKAAKPKKSPKEKKETATKKN